MDMLKLAKRNAICMTIEGALFNISMAFIATETVIAGFMLNTTQSVALVGIASAIMSFAFQVGQFICGLFVHKIKKQIKFMRIISISTRTLLLIFAAMLLLGLDGKLSAYIFIVLFTVIFIFDGFVGLCWKQIMARTMPVNMRGEVFAAQQIVCGAASVAVGFIVQRILSSQFDIMTRYNICFVLSGIVFFASALTMLLFRDLPHVSFPEIPVKNPISYIGKSLVPLFKRSRAARQSGLSLTLMLMAVMVSAVNYKLGETSGLTEYQLSLLVYMPVAGQILGGVFWQQVSKRTCFPIMMYWSQIAGVVCSVVNALTLVMAIMNMPIMVPLSVSMALVRFTSTANSAFSQHVIAICEEKERSDFIVLFSLIALPSALLPVLAGAIAEWSLIPVYALAVVGSIIGVFQTRHFFISEKSPLPKNERL